MNRNTIIKNISKKELENVLNKIIVKYKNDQDINTKKNINIFKSEDFYKIKKVIDEVIGGDLILLNDKKSYDFIPNIFYEGDFK